AVDAGIALRHADAGRAPVGAGGGWRHRRAATPSRRAGRHRPVAGRERRWPGAIDRDARRGVAAGAARRPHGSGG
ncbi:hypothetical protein CN437_28265, partial [Bacillus cereus]